MTKILSKVIVARFYQVNLAFFLMLFILFFGIVNGKDAMLLHYAIMKSMTGSIGFSGIAMGVWALYNFKCISFCLREMDRAENNFLFNLQALDNKRQFLLFLESQAAIYFPILVYGTIAIIIGYKEQHFLVASLFLIFQFLMCAVGAGIYVQRINNTWKRPAMRLPSFDIFRKKNIDAYLLYFSLNQRKGTFIGIKLFSLLLLQIMVSAISNSQGKEAICVLIMFLISAHSLLPLFYVGFFENEMAFIRNTSLPLFRRFSVFVFTYSVIFLPELLFLLCNVRSALPLQVILSLYALAVSQLSLYTSILYIKGIKSERYTTIVFAIFFLTLLLLASTSLWFVFVAECIIAVAMFYGLYWRYEVTEEKSE